MTDSRDDTIAKLTADNAALVAERDKALAAAEAMRAESEGFNAGWVSPEDHARVVQATADEALKHARDLAAERDANWHDLGVQRRLKEIATENLADVLAERDAANKELGYWMSEVDTVEAILVAAGISDAVEPKLTNKARELVEQRDAARARLAEVEVILAQCEAICDPSIKFTPESLAARLDDKNDTIAGLEKRLAEAEAERMASEKRYEEMVDTAQKAHNELARVKAEAATNRR